MKVLFVSNYPSPYRVDFFNLLGQYVDLTVVFTERPEAQKHRSSQWFTEDYSGFNAIFLNDRVKLLGLTIFKDIFPFLKNNFDYIIFGGYTSGTQMSAIEYMKCHKIPFTIEADGGLISNESKLKFFIKTHFISSADSWLSTGKVTTEYFKHYGAQPEKIYEYPFTSLCEKDILADVYKNLEEKRKLRNKLKIEEPKMILFVGQIIHRKGIDILLKAAQKLPEDIAVVIVGGEPSEEYIALKEQLHLSHIYFLGFKTKDELGELYQAADIFVMPTREDIWGLVINEAMNFGLPILSTNRCVAALELVENNVNGIIVSVDDPDALSQGIIQLFNSDLQKMGQQSKLKIQQYTLENMVKAHLNFFNLNKD